MSRRTKWSRVLSVSALLAVLAACGGGAFTAAGPDQDASGDATVDAAGDAGQDTGPIMRDSGRRDSGVVDVSTQDTRPEPIDGEAGPDAIEEALADGQKDVTDAAVDAADGTLGAPDADAGADAVMLDAERGDACALAMVDPTAGVFVVSGSTSLPASCGAMMSPCGTVNDGISRASSTPGKTIVYVADGQYPESLQLVAGLTIQGGWVVAGTMWTPDCASDGGVTTIFGTAQFTGGGTVSLSTLNLKNVAIASAGESLYGLIVHGTGATAATVNLDGVNIEVAKGGDGAPAVAGLPGSTGAAGACGPAGTGADGTPGAGSMGGAFSAMGYAPGSGDAGTMAQPGIAGMITAGPTCAECGACAANACVPSAGGKVCGTSATPGCGGGAGGGGGGGGGGGSSIAIFAVGSAVVNITGGVVSTGKGGAGADGGSGGAAGPGGFAIPGSPTTLTCSGNNICDFSSQGTTACTQGNAQGQGGTATGGSPGGKGGLGGGGAGGDSVVIVTVITPFGTPTVTPSGVNLMPGAAGGSGSPGGAPGMSAMKLAF